MHSDQSAIFYVETAVVVRLLLPLVFLAGSPRSQPPASPVAVERVSITGDPAHPKLQFDLTNNTDATVTAWGVNIAIHVVNGSTVQSQLTGTGVDCYKTFAGAFGLAVLDPTVRAFLADYGCPIPPHTTVHYSRGERADVPASAIEDVDVTFRDAIFSDGTWMGDEPSVDGSFAQRQAEYQALKETIPVLKNARENHQGAEALQWALDELNRDAGNMRKERDRMNLRLALGGKISRPAEDVLSHLIADHEAELVAADQHRRKGLAAVFK